MKVIEQSNAMKEQVYIYLQRWVEPLPVHIIVRSLRSGLQKEYTTSSGYGAHAELSMTMSLKASGTSGMSSFHLRRVAHRAVAASASYADVVILAENIKIDTVVPNSQCFGVLQIFSA